jgi:hypothetical protein
MRSYWVDEDCSPLTATPATSNFPSNSKLQAQEHSSAFGCGFNLSNISTRILGSMSASTAEKGVLPTRGKKRKSTKSDKESEIILDPNFAPSPLSFAERVLEVNENSP